MRRLHSATLKVISEERIMKKVLAINASPRKKWNTAMALQSALEGAASAGAETKLIHLAGLKFTGCISCFACKRHENNAAICAIRDDLRPILEEAMEADAIIVGSPVYFSNLDAFAIAFLERLLFMNYTYSMQQPSKLNKKIASGLILTMNATDDLLEPLGYNRLFRHYADTMGRILLGPSEYLAITDTLQFTDYSRYMSSIFDPEHKKKMREEKFPKDLQACRELGQRLVLG